MAVDLPKTPRGQAYSVALRINELTQARDAILSEMAHMKYIYVPGHVNALAAVVRIGSEADRITAIVDTDYVPEGIIAWF